MHVSAFPAHVFVYMYIPWCVHGLDRESEMVLSECCDGVVNRTQVSGRAADLNSRAGSPGSPLSYERKGETYRFVLSHVWRLTYATRSSTIIC